jgi:hypothetical protein
LLGLGESEMIFVQYYNKNPANSNEWAYESVGAILENSPKCEELLEILRK